MLYWLTELTPDSVAATPRATCSTTRARPRRALTPRPRRWASLEDFAAGAVLELALEPGDVLVMLTDGVVEAESPEQQVFGDQRALEVVRANLHAPAAAIVEALHQAAREFCQARSTRTTSPAWW